MAGAPLEDRYVGTLVGAVLGDALGAPLEFMSREQILIKHGEVRDLLGGGWLGLRPGEGTDETELMLALARSLAKEGEHRPDQVAAAYLHWYQEKPTDVSNGMRPVLEEMAQGHPPDQAVARAEESSPPEMVDHFVLVRCAPLALCYPGHPEQLAQAAVAEAALTHGDERAGWGAASYAILLAEAMRGGESKEAAYDRAMACLEDGPADVIPLLPDRRAISAIDTQAEPTAIRNTAEQVDTLESAVHHFLRYDSAEEALVRLLNLGGDTDGAATVCGALLGAWHGEAALPQRWLGRLRARPEARAYARRLFRRANAAPDADAPLT